MALALLLFAEARYDAFAVECLLDRALAEAPGSPSWIIDGLDAGEVTCLPGIVTARQGVRAWIDPRRKEVALASDAFWDVHRLSVLADALRQAGKFKISRGRFDGDPGKHAAKLGRKALDLAQDVARGRAVDVVMLALDMDTDVSRCEGLDQARREAQGKGAPFQVVLACPVQCTEAWVIAAFEVGSLTERERWEDIKNNLGFDPCAQSHRLHHDHARRDGSSEVLRALTNGDSEREERALRRTALDTLKARGDANGLRSFLDEVTARIGPLLRARTARQ
jgi:hypothetical protein